MGVRGRLNRTMNPYVHSGIVAGGDLKAQLIESERINVNQWGFRISSVG